MREGKLCVGCCAWVRVGEKEIALLSFCVLNGHEFAFVASIRFLSEWI